MLKLRMQYIYVRFSASLMRLVIVVWLAVKEKRFGRFGQLAFSAVFGVSDFWFAFVVSRSLKRGAKPPEKRGRGKRRGRAGAEGQRRRQQKPHEKQTANQNTNTSNARSKNKNKNHTKHKTQDAKTKTMETNGNQFK